MKIRKASFKDIPKILDFWNSLLEIHKKRDPVFFKTKINIMEKFKSFLKMNFFNWNKFIYVAEEDGKIIGSLFGSIEKRFRLLVIENIGYINTLYVLPEYQDYGITPKLVAEFIKWLRRKRIEYCELVLYSPDKTVISLWESLGFSEYMRRYRRRV